MSGRHASGRVESSSWPRRLALSAVAIAVLAAGGFAVASLLDDPAASDCADPVPVTVAADATVAPVLSDLAAAYSSGAVEDACAEVTVQPSTAQDVIAALGTPDSPDLWVPASAELTARSAAADATVLGHVATSPLVVVMSRATATQLGWPDVDYSWRQVLTAEQPRIGDAATSDEGLASLVALRSAFGADAEPTDLVRAMTLLSRSAMPTVQPALGSDGDEAVFVAAEQAVVRHNRESPESPVVALYPSEGTLAFDYPALAVERPQADPAVDDALRDFVGYLGSTEAVERIREAGFRSSDGRAGELAGVTGGIQPAMPTLLPMPDADQVTAIAQQWAVLARDTRMLAVIDVSGSMNEPTGSGATRIELTRDAAIRAVQLFPPTSSVGLWAFSTLQDPPRDHVELVGIGPLGEPVDGAARVDTLVSTIQSLPQRVQGGTGLYDTALAAFRAVMDSYEADKVNSVVLLTDGRNEDDPDGIDAETLLTTLRDEFDPARPVPVITIGMGPEADMATLQQISAATGTVAHQALDPRDIEDVFVRAMLERQCRPNC